MGTTYLYYTRLLAITSQGLAVMFINTVGPKPTKSIKGFDDDERQQFDILIETLAKSSTTTCYCGTIVTMCCLLY